MTYLKELILRSDPEFPDPGKHAHASWVQLYKILKRDNILKILKKMSQPKKIRYRLLRQVYDMAGELAAGGEDDG